jgi:hypothetical protein
MWDIETEAGERAGEIIRAFGRMTITAEMLDREIRLLKLAEGNALMQVALLAETARILAERLAGETARPGPAGVGGGTVIPLAGTTGSRTGREALPAGEARDFLSLVRPV